MLPTTGIVDSTMAQYLEDSITQAEGRNVAAVVIKLNTPGGDMDLSVQGEYRWWAPQ